MTTPYNQVVAERTSLGGSVVIGSGALTPAFIGVSLGKDTTVTDESVTKGVNSGSDILANDNVRSVIQISDSEDGSADYTENVDFQLIGSDGSGYYIDWSLANTIDVPALDSAQSASGYMTAGTYYFVVTARNGNGETTRSNEVSAAVTGGGVKLTWAPVIGATSYRIYKTSTSGTYGASSLVTTTSGTSYTVTTDTLVSGTVPSSNTALHAPVQGASYYVSYKYGAITANTPTILYSLEDAKSEYGTGSHLSNLIEKAMGAPGFGNSCSKVIGVAVGEDTSPSYITALATLKTQDCQLIVLGKLNSGLMSAGKSHVETYSNIYNGRYRYLIGGPEAGLSSTVIKTRAEALDSRRVIYVTPAASTGIKGYTQDTDGSYTEKSLGNEYLCAAIAGMISKLRDTATPTLRKSVDGFTTLVGTVYDKDQKDDLRTSGCMVIETDEAQTNGVIRVYGDTTTDVSTTENRLPSINFSDDYLIRQLKTNCDQYIGKKITTNLLNAIRTTTKNVLGYFTKNELISTWNTGSLVIQQDTVNTTWIQIYFSYTPVYSSEVLFFNYGFSTAAA